ncbi:transcriptional regulator, tetR family [Sanguibacter keddieii DSM 10542]|uniref:Transcriptional regulator, tetR family n=1 Tax=Sanguibacter keddieii (strain ATCC 51767 / DSM 10542 / NCFB 3025 / ST-74) TaxID=446469 RepID=D1BHH8_SANKS|nr:TetR/AcrR family transcriptional regulator [Sanguibacter keddieii]ACZ21898.1 transcriptional regulator, tetR family [Sanguibacter keddieii DSM 10542]
MSALRSDAARSRARILDAARTLDRATLRLNDVAREAGVGVGTVYRHFPTVHALVEALSADTLDTMLATSRRAAADPDPGDGLALYLRSALTLQLEDGGLQAVLLSPDDEAESVRTAKREIFESFTSVLESARAAGIVRPDLTVDHLAHLVCGIEHAVRLGTPDDFPLLLQVMLDGLRPPASR